MLKTPISYYGGKQRLAKTIISLIPDHTLYAEPFLGGGAVFWAKPPSKIEVINDVNEELINFYFVSKHHYKELEKLIQSTLHSRTQHREAQVIYKTPSLFTKIQRAWAVWVLASQSYGSILTASWGSTKKNNSMALKIFNKKKSFIKDYTDRLEKVQIENTYALRIIRYKDSEDTFFYCDPPYINSDQGHYEGYTKENFKALLEALKNIKGKFLLSSYPSSLLDEYTKENGWCQKKMSSQVAVATRNKKPNKTKIEVLTANYPLD
ncbi:DNA adenine methylase [Tenacibaculum agarivorans]|uniref:DNA adenine methylase n=1 Tax=Tenacibaculum agarivorans TaxID=1908389 RepID=UPI00094BA81D|nr:DNA adenine methylase [Tenacibaculum agarivorans]